MKGEVEGGKGTAKGRAESSEFFFFSLPPLSLFFFVSISFLNGIFHRNLLKMSLSLAILSVKDNVICFVRLKAEAVRGYIGPHQQYINSEMCRRASAFS